MSFSLKSARRVPILASGPVRPLSYSDAVLTSPLDRFTARDAGAIASNRDPDKWSTDRCVALRFRRSGMRWSSSLERSEHDLVDLPEAGHHGWSWTQDISAVERVDLPVRDRAYLLPARPRPDGGDVDGAATPRCEDDLGVPPRDLGRVDPPLPCGAAGPELREYVAPARDLDDLRHPADAGDEGLGPFLEVDAGALRPHARELPHLSDLVANVLNEVAGRALQPEHATDERDGLQDLVDRALVRAQHGCAGPDQLRAHVRLQIGKGQDEIRLEREDPVDAEGREAPDPGLVPGLGRPVRRAGDSDDPLARAEGIADLDVLSGQTDDAPGQERLGLAVHVALA